MSSLAHKIAGTIEISARVSSELQKHLAVARERFDARVKKARTAGANAQAAMHANPWRFWCNYAADSAQRSVLFWDVLRQRGNQFIEHERAGMPSVLHFESEIIMDGRTFERPVNYALLRLLPPPGVTTDPLSRPYIIIDPRAGHGPGIGNAWPTRPGGNSGMRLIE